MGYSPLHTGGPARSPSPCTQPPLSCHQPPLATSHSPHTAGIPLPTVAGAVGVGVCRHVGCRTHTCAHHVDAHKMVARATTTRKPSGLPLGWGGHRVRLRPGDTAGWRWDASTHHHPLPRPETPSRSGPREPCCARGQPHVVTGDTCPWRPDTTTRCCVTSGRCHQPTDFVTPWTGGDRHPVAPVDSHSSWELGRTQTRPPSGPRPPQRSCLGPAVWEATGTQGLVLFAGNTGIYNALFLNPPSPRLWLLWGGGGWNRALSLPCF